MKVMMKALIALSILMSASLFAATSKVHLKQGRFKKRALPTQGFVETSFGSATVKGGSGFDTISLTPGIRSSYLKGLLNGKFQMPIARTDDGQDKSTSTGRPEFSADYKTNTSRRSDLRVGGALQLPIYNNSADGFSGDFLDSLQVWGIRPYMTYERRLRSKANLLAGSSLQWNQTYSDTIQKRKFKITRAMILKANAGLEFPYDRRLSFGTQGHMALGLGKHKIRADGARIPGFKQNSIRRLAVEAYARARFNKFSHAFVGFNLGLTGNSFHTSELLTEYENSNNVTNSVRFGITQIF